MKNAENSKITLSGVVEEIVFRNAENGYTVLTIASNNGSGTSGGEIFTAVGIFPPVAEGEQLTMEGEVKFNSKFGEQFSVSNVKLSPPSSVENIKKFLASGILKHCGEVTAALIADKFGVDTLDILENAPYRISDIKGIGMKRAIEIGECYRENKVMKDTLIYLQQFDISINLAIKIFKVYHNTTINVLLTNPYRIVEDVDGIGFLTADKIALAMKLDPHSAFRIRAGIVYALKDNAMRGGNTAMEEKSLICETQKLLTFDESMREDITNLVNSMIINKELVVIEKEGENLVMSEYYYRLEKNISEKILSMAAQDTATDKQLEPYYALIKAFEDEHKIRLHPIQIKAIITALSGGVSVITGGPGTGKTTIIKTIIYILEQNQMKYLLTAPTGRAAKRMTEATGVEAKTIHRLLDLNYKGQNAAAQFTYNEQTRLETNIVIADETSMCDEFVFSSLIKAIPAGAGFVMVGDVDQLPSVGAGNVLKDIIESGTIPVVRLTHIYRQDEKSLIITNSHRINSGELPLFDNSSKDFFFIQKSDPSEITREIVGLCKGRIQGFMNVSAEDIQVLCPMKKGLNGVINMNAELQKNLNPPSHSKAELKTSENVFRVGDKVIHMENNYNLEWTRSVRETTTLQGSNVKKLSVNVTTGTGVFNGDIGYVTAVDKAAMIITITFEDGRIAEYTSDIVDQLQLAYAISVHKSQGSEFPVVIISLMSGSPVLLTKNLLYTAVTRAKNMVVLVGEKSVISRMTTNNFCQKRYTLLKDFLTRRA